MNWITYSIPVIEYTRYGEKHKHINQPVNMALIVTYFKAYKQINFYYNSHNTSTSNIIWKFESEEETDKIFDHIGTFLNIKTI